MDYTKQTVPSLKQMCKERKIRGYSKKTKTELIVVLRGYDEKEKNGEKDIEEPMFGRELRKHFQQNVFTDELVAELQNIVDITTIIDPKKLK